MTLGAAFQSLGAIDARSIARDPLLRWIALLTPAMALLLRFGAPPIADSLGRRFAVNLEALYPLLVSFLPISTAAMTGTVFGFLLLDQRDDGTLPALLVTPLTTSHYLFYRLTALMLTCAALSAITLPLSGLTEMTIAQAMLVSAVAAPLAPIYAFVLVTFASNKVQGFALAKALGVVAIPCMVAYFVSPPWQHAFGLLPHYWSLKVFWLFDDGRRAQGVLNALLGIAFQAAVLHLLLRRFLHVLRR